MSIHIIRPGRYDWRGTCQRCGCQFIATDSHTYGITTTGDKKACAVCPHCDANDVDVTPVENISQS